MSLVAWAGLRFIDTTQDELQPAAVPAPLPPTPVTTESAESTAISALATALPPEQTPPPPANTSPEALHEVIPDVPPKIREDIRGRIHVTVRVLVDPSGNVVGALIEEPGPSKYFARLADNASREWRFMSVDGQRERVWLLRFEFRSDGTSAQATQQ